MGREGRIQLRSYTDNIGILQQYDEQNKVWLLAAFERGRQRTERSSSRLNDFWAGSFSPAPLTQKEGAPAAHENQSPDPEASRLTERSTASLRELWGDLAPSPRRDSNIDAPAARENQGSKPKKPAPRADDTSMVAKAFKDEARAITVQTLPTAWPAGNGLFAERYRRSGPLSLAEATAAHSCVTPNGSTAA